MLENKGFDCAVVRQGPLTLNDPMKDIKELLLGVPVSKPPAGGQHETYITFNEVLGEYEAHASNQARRPYHMVQLHVFSKRDNGTHRALFFRAIDALRAAGVRVRSYGPDDYETTTGYHHIAATCEWVENINQEV